MSKRREIDKAIAHLMQWAERPEWADEMNTIFDRNTVDAADSLGMEVNEVLEVLYEHDLMHMIIGFCAEDLATYRFPPDGRNLIEDFLKRRGWREGVHGRRYLRRLGKSVLSLYEVQSVVPGSHCDVVDLVRGGKPVHVYEKSGTLNLARWDRIGARILQGDGRPMFSGVILPYSHDSSEVLLNILHNTRDNERAALTELGMPGELSNELDAAIEADFLQHSNMAFSQMWLADTIAKIEVPLPELINRDGDSLLFAETRFKFDKNQRQKIIALLDGTEDWERHDERDPNWAWLPEGKTGSQTIFGFLEARDDDLCLMTNSTSRYEKGSAVLAELLGDLVGPPLTSLQSPEQMIEEQHGHDSSPSPLADPEIDPQELAQIVSGYFDQHYRETLDDQIPALDGKTPRQCVKTRKGREKVIEWLKYLENQESHKANRDGSVAYDFSWMWDELGLEKPNGR
jgi:hypothetical protein